MAGSMELVWKMQETGGSPHKEAAFFRMEAVEKRALEESEMSKI